MSLQGQANLQKAKKNTIQGYEVVFRASYIACFYQLHEAPITRKMSLMTHKSINYQHQLYWLCWYLLKVVVSWSPCMRATFHAGGLCSVEVYDKPKVNA